VGPRAGLEAAEKIKFLTLPGFELRPLGHTAHSQSVYRLPYPCSNICIKAPVNCCWSSPAQSFLFSGPRVIYDLIYIRFKTVYVFGNGIVLFDERTGLLFLSWRHISCTVNPRECTGSHTASR
jgi:hypothetical protein